MRKGLGAKIVIGYYKLMGLDISPIVSDWRRFNFFAGLFFWLTLVGLLMGVIGMLVALNTLININVY